MVLATFFTNDIIFFVPLSSRNVVHSISCTSLLPLVRHGDDQSDVSSGVLVLASGSLPLFMVFGVWKVRLLPHQSSSFPSVPVSLKSLQLHLQIPVPVWRGSGSERRAWMKAAAVFRCRIMGCASRTKRGRWRPRHGWRRVDGDSLWITKVILHQRKHQHRKTKVSVKLRFWRKIWDWMDVTSFDELCFLHGYT